MKTLLTIDDSKVALVQVEKYTKRRFPDCEILSTTNPIEGIKIAEEHKDQIDIVILDYNMKEMNGLETLEALSSMISTSKIVICTANLQKIIAEKVVNKGARIISKPLTQDKIDEILQAPTTKAS